ncbi:MAG TPA: cellulase family glycosylhydrolase [Steroidobacteraceae bacterium]|nr:cellulase family glycosylhydrolase [Steroidobacteraceae bacterium]
MKQRHTLSFASWLAVLGALAPPFAPTTAAAAPAGKSVLGARVSNGQLVSADGKALILRGVNVSGLEDYAIQGWAWNGDHTHYEPWGGDRPRWPAILAWHANAVRIPLNEASWLGLTTYDHDGKPRQADPGRNYQSTVINSVREANAAGLYVILDLHWSGPHVPIPGRPGLLPQTPFEAGGAQNPMADADDSLSFWTSIATTFKNNPAVMFELFNEPYFWWLSPGESEWPVWRDGGTITQYVTGANPYQLSFSWHSAGMQQMLLAVRATGATNIVIAGGVNWCGDMSGWLAHRPEDPTGQLVAAWHAYPDPKAPTTPAHGAAQYTYLQDLIAKGIPVMITETGDHNAPGTAGSPFVSTVLPWADRHGVSYLGWTWNPWQNPDNVLIRDASGAPTDGYGRYFRDHLLCVSTGAGDCP